jgi:hypothetical protein
VPVHVLIGIELPGMVMVNVPPAPLNVPVMVMRAAHWKPPKPTVPVKAFPAWVICQVMAPTEPIMPGPMPGPIEMPRAVPFCPAGIASAAVPSHVPATPWIVASGADCAVSEDGAAGGVDDPFEHAVMARVDATTTMPMEAGIRNSYPGTRQ